MSKQRKSFAIQLRVAEAKQKDVGKSRAKLDPESMSELKVAQGDMLEILGKKATVALAWKVDPEDESIGAVRIDGQTRKNSGSAINEFATIRRIESLSAKSVSLVPIGTKGSMDKDFAQFVRNRLKGTPVVIGDELSVIVLGNPIAFKVQKVRPKGCVRIEQSTLLTILPEAVVSKNIVQTASYDEIGGLGEEIRRLREIVELPLRHPELFQKLGVEPPNGILLYGPPGCGKTLLARALANECEANFYTMNGPEIMNKYYGETEGKLRDLFKEAKENSPSIIFVDEIDALAPRREETFGDVEKRVVGQLLALMDGVADRGDVVVIGATNRPESIDPALRRPGRFDREVQVGVPNTEARQEILLIHTRGMPLSNDIELEKMATELYGYTGADIRALCREAALKALRRYVPDIDVESERLPPDVIEKMQVTSMDFKDASKEIVPTAMREYFTEIPKLSWEEIGGLHSVKQMITENVVWAIKDRARFQKVGVSPARGILLYGPPGCGKSMLVRALATESGANLITVRGPEVLSKWLGESEKAIREIFKKAKSSSPCIIFLDELDSIAVTRSGYSQQSDRVLSQMLAEIDTLGSSGEIFLIGATNRPDLVDVSLLRPGRLELLIYVPPPDEEARAEILRILVQGMPLSPSISLKTIASQTKGYTGADLKSVCREAGIEALRRNSETPLLTQDDFVVALSRIKPVLSAELENWFSGVQKKLKGAPAPEGFIG
ncbi:MAG: CDC48 family AAA ATPase [Thaumarchaeota archaeon]|nr:CDC48 family AAA ATPase [Nitrososphaerota archaeon]